VIIQWRQQILKYQIVSFWGSEDSVSLKLPVMSHYPADISLFFKIVSDKSAKFGTLPGDVENVVKLKGGHSDICRFSPKDEVDVDNLELVVCNIMDLYDIALRESESEKSKLSTKQALQSSSESVQAPRKNPIVAGDDLESRLERLRGGSFPAS